MQALLIYYKEDPQIITLKNASVKCGYTIKCCKNIEETHEAFKKVNYDLVFIDCRRQLLASASTHHHNANSSSGANLTSDNNVTTSNQQYDYENICKFIRELFQYTVIAAITPNYDDRDIPNVLPLLKIGFNRIFTETTNINKCVNELLTLEYGELATVKRLQAAHILFTALEYSNDPIEILNDQLKILYVNNAFEKLTGYSLNELSGQDFNRVHGLEESNQKFSRKQLSQGNAWENELSFKKTNGDVINHLAITIPVTVVQGETNKIQNYITITNLSDKTTTTTGNAISVRKVPSFNLSKRSNEFERFASGMFYSNATPLQTPLDDNLTSNHITEVVSSADPTGSSSIPADEAKASLTSLETEKSLSSSNFEKDYYLQNKYNFQRKRSYDLQSTTSSTSLVTNTNFYDQFPRRHSMARNLNNQTFEAPIRKVINIICLAHEKSNTDIVKKNLDKALDILRSTELYSPSLMNNDKATSDLVSGLMSNGFQKNGKASIIGTRQLLSAVSSSISQSYVRNLPLEITNILDKEELWSFDVISLERLTNKRPLVTLGLKTMTRFNVCEHLKIDQTILVNWLTLIESNYRASNPYHNSTHASDVLHATSFFLSTNTISQVFDDNDRVASLIAAAIHDLNHPGRTNAFLCNSNNELAILYNDQAVLENHHAALAFQLTRQNEDANIFKNLTRDEYRTLRSIIIDMVLATEMNKHFEHLNKFINKFGINDGGSSGSGTNATGAVQNTTNENNNSNCDLQKMLENKVLIKRILIKCADVSNPCRPLDIYKEWVERIASEYFDQTDEEKQKDLPVVMPTFDRTSCNVPKAQLGFIEYFINDMFEAWDDFIDIPEVISNLHANIVYWRERAEALQLQQLQQLQQKHNSQLVGGSQQASASDQRNNSILEDDDENEIDNDEA